MLLFLSRTCFSVRQIHTFLYGYHFYNKSFNIVMCTHASMYSLAVIRFTAFLKLQELRRLLLCDKEGYTERSRCLRTVSCKIVEVPDDSENKYNNINVSSKLC